ncbi:sensor domain-containing diguanylate cyclase [Methylobacterium sp. J-090]|uniref:GGDEF domain-containing protein n=1 Tax=Methylobacterium sp. J-090 TaxID=2836666 RepID=UPI001FB8A245|nr:GGDEF domain-containing protein [Methylobacterium sp. J-090]MCJ2082879.1 GGDEF domain-containing protein [Methylobacterium sp. J-090]
MNVEDLNAWLARYQSFGLVRLPGALEATFAREEREPQRRIGLVGVSLGTLYFLLLMVLDWDIDRDLFWTSFVLRLGIAIPINCSMIWILLDPERRAATYQAAASIAAGMACVTFSILFAQSYKLAALTYLSANIIVMGFTINLLGLSTLASAIVCGVSLSSMLTAVTLSPISNGAVVTTYALVGAMVAFTSILANHCLQNERRRNYATMLREEIHLEQIARQQAMMEKLAAIDPLTQIANRRGFDAQLDDALAHSIHGNLSVAMIDIDYFKRFNDTYGHPKGDEVLCSVALCLSQACGSLALVGRMGGEEFAIAAVDMRMEAFHPLAERLCRAVEALGITHRNNDAAPVVTVSMGLASGSAVDRRACRALFQAADEALYEAKTSGRNRIVASTDHGQATPEVRLPAVIQPSLEH